MDNKYTPPSSRVSALIQMPMYQITADKLITAYFLDSQDARKSKREQST